MPYIFFRFHKDLAKLRKPLQQKPKNEVSWTWTTNDAKIVQNFKKCAKIFLFLIYLIKKIYFLRQMPARSAAVRYSKSKKEENSVNIAVKVLIRQNAIIPRWKKRSLQSKGIEKLVNF